MAVLPTFAHNNKLAVSAVAGGLAGGVTYVVTKDPITGLVVGVGVAGASYLVISMDEPAAQQSQQVGDLRLLTRKGEKRSEITISGPNSTLAEAGLLGVLEKLPEVEAKRMAAAIRQAAAS